MKTERISVTAKDTGFRTAGSNFGMEESAAIADKKFEGFSNLKQRSETQAKRATRAQNAKQADDLDIQYIDNLQRQIATMEQEVKLLKDREIESKNKASGYETLLRDGIPLNEHFLALKNKYNNDEKAKIEQRKNIEAQQQMDMRENDERRNRIRIMKGEYDRLAEEFRRERELKEKELKT